MKTLNVSEETKDRVTRLAGVLTSQKGKFQTQDDAVKFLLDFWEKAQLQESEKP